MKNDEQRPEQSAYQSSPQPQPGWTYNQEWAPAAPARPPSGYLPNPETILPTPSAKPVPGRADNPISQPLTDAYYPDLTMDMGGSLGYSQSIQYHAISMPQPTQALPRVRQERFLQLREERMRNQQRRMGRDITTMMSRKRLPDLPQSRSASPARTQSGQLGPSSSPLNAYPPFSGDLTQQGGATFSPGARADFPASVAANPGQVAGELTQNTTEVQRVKVARASSLISGAFLFSSILGLVQTFMFTYIFGRSIPGNAYLQAYLVPNLIYTVIAGGALSSAFIPVFTFYSVQKKDEKTAWHIASSALNLSVGGMIIFSIIALFLVPFLAPLYSRPDEVALVITLTRIMLIQAIVLGSGVIVGAVLNTKQDFTRTALGAVLYNVGLNLGLLPGMYLAIYTPSSSLATTAVYAATWGVVLGALLQVGVQIPGLFKVKMRYTFAFDWRHPGVRQIGRQMVPRIINAVMLSFSTGVDRYLLSFLSDGLISPYLQAFSIFLLPISLFGSSVSTAAFPTLASYAARGRYERVRSIIMETLRAILFLTIPSGVGLAVLAFPIAQALLEHGSFDLLATQYASFAVFFFALGLPSLAAVEILTRSFYALQDSKTPVTISVLQFILKIALSVLLINMAVWGIQWGIGALALSTAIAGTLEAMMLFILLSRRIGGFDIRAFWKFVGQVLLASGVLAIVLLVLRLSLDHAIDTTSMKKLPLVGIFKALAKLLIELGFGSAAFLIVARLLKIEEINSGLVRRVLNLLRVPWL